MSETAKLAPLPWTVDLGEDCAEPPDAEVLDANGFTVATVEMEPLLNRWNEHFPDMKHWAEGARDGRTQIERPVEQVRAMAHLFKASPKLLAALIWLTNLGCGIGRGGDSPEPGEFEAAINEARAAIAEATGQPVGS